MTDKLLELYQEKWKKEKTRRTFFEWLDGFPDIIKVGIILFIILSFGVLGYLIGMLIKTWR